MSLDVCVSIVGILLEISGFIFLLPQIKNKIDAEHEHMYPAGLNPPTYFKYRFFKQLKLHKEPMAIILVISGLSLQIIGLVLR